VLTIGAGGEIKNASGSYSITQSGMSIANFDPSSPDLTRALTLGGGYIWGNQDGITLDTEIGIQATQLNTPSTIKVGTSGNAVITSPIASSLTLSVGGSSALTAKTDGDIQIDQNLIAVGGTFSGTVTVGNATAGGHALNRTTADGRYLLQSALFDSGAGTATNNRIIDITFGGNVYRINCELLP
jgi:hypothetical protein